MKTFILICLFALAAAASLDKFEDFMNLDVEKMMGDETRRKQILGCFLDELPCGEYQPYRDLIPDIIATNCGECTPEQKKKFEEANKYMLENYPAEFTAVLNKYGPKKE